MNILKSSIAEGISANVKRIFLLTGPIKYCKHLLFCRYKSTRIIAAIFGIQSSTVVTCGHIIKQPPGSYPLPSSSKNKIISLQRVADNFYRIAATYWATQSIVRAMQ